MAGKSEGGWRPGGSSGPVRRGARPDWAPTADTPVRRTRRVKQLGLLALLAGIVGFGIWLAYFLMPPSPPVLLVVSTDPAADAGDLSVPIDPYGWLSGKEFIKWSQRYEAEAPADKKRHVPRASDGSDILKNNETIKTAQDLANWAVGEARHSGKFKKPSETAIIYFGLHTGADAKGPFLYANKGRKFHVEELLQSLSEAMGETKVLVLFDPGRLPPNPAIGQLDDGFAEGVKAMDAKIAGYGNLSVMLGCDVGERGWESEEWQRTAFAHAVLEGLSGKAKPTNERDITARDLFKYVSEATATWTQRNRPAAQHPVLLPSTGEERAAATKLALHHDLPEQQPPAVRDPLPDIREQWQKYGEFAFARPPTPDVFSPRHWRRYRELMLRYEFVARAGDETTRGVLENSLSKEAGEIRRAQKNAIIGESARASTPMWQASGKEPAADARSEISALGKQFFLNPARGIPPEFTAKLAQLPNDRIAYSRELIDELLKLPSSSTDAFRLRAQLLREVWREQRIRPPDVQLLLMLDQFYGQITADPLPSETDPKGALHLWQRALQVRRHAEEASLGPATNEHPYSEVIWRVVQDVVRDGDSHRRTAEDALFAPAGPDRLAAFEQFDRAAAQYKRAIDRARELRAALALRDRVLADLPLLGRWTILEPDDSLTVKPWDVLHDAHRLAGIIDKLPPESAESGSPPIEAKYLELRTAAEVVLKGSDAIGKAYAARLRAELQDPQKLQKAWLSREQLLAVPPLPDSPDPLGDRMQLLAVNRAATAYFLDPRNALGNAKTDARERVNSKERGIALGYLGLNEIGKEAIDSQSEANVVNPSFDSVRDELNKVRETHRWEDVAAAGERLGKHYRVLAEAADVAATDPKAVEVERFSRSAIAFAPRDGAEPVEINRKFRWQRLLYSQARRTVLDHWYDDRQPFYRDVAAAFLKDAEALTPPDPTHASDRLPGHDLKTLLELNDDQFKAYSALANAEPLKVTASQRESLWTTEAQLRVGFALNAPAVPPGGRLAAWAAIDSKSAAGRVQFAAGAAVRRLLDLKSGPLPDSIIVTEAASSAHETLAVRRSVFFRGQFLRDDAQVALHRQPDVVITHARPQENELPRVAFVGPHDVDVGAVTIVIDYSPSMYDKPANGGKPRIKRTWEELRSILKDLPDGTRLTVRGFGVAPEGNQSVKAEEFESAATKGGIDKDDLMQIKYPGTYDRQVLAPRIVDWGKNPQSLNVIIGILENVPLVAGEDRGRTNSPVIRTMLHAAREDYADVKEYQTKILVVLTDGEDNSCWDYSNKEKPVKDFGPLAIALKREFTEGKGKGIAVRMLLIKDDDNKEKAADIERFRKQIKVVLDGLEPPGNILFDEVKELGRELSEILRPRVRIAHEDPKATEALRRGIPIRFDRPRLERPEWSELPNVGEYEAWVGRKPPLDDRQILRFSPADHLMVNLSRPNPNERVRFDRAIWGRYSSFGDELKQAGRQQENAEKTWLASAVMYRGSIHGYEGENIQEKGPKMLDLTMAVESLRSPEGQPLRQMVPAFAWWELVEEPGVKLSIARAPLYVWREYGQPAPAWRLRRRGWTDDTDNQLPAGKLLAWTEQREKALKPRQTTTITDLSPETAAGLNLDGAAWVGTWKDDDTGGKKWYATFGWEKHVFATNPETKEIEKERNCLAIRVYIRDPKQQSLTPAGKAAPFFVQVDGARVEEHRFFRADGAYTGFFYLGPSTSPDSARNRKVNLFSVVDLIDSKVSASFEVPLPKTLSDGSDKVWSIWEQQYAPKKP